MFTRSHCGCKDIGILYNASCVKYKTTLIDKVKARLATGPGLDNFLQEAEREPEQDWNCYEGKLIREKGDHRLRLPPWLKTELPTVYVYIIGNISATSEGRTSPQGGPTH